MSLSNIATELGLSITIFSDVINGKDKLNNNPKTTQDRIRKYAYLIDCKPKVKMDLNVRSSCGS